MPVAAPPMPSSVRPPLADGWPIPVVFASGFAGLGYEMVWTRELSVALGSDMMAVLGSIAGLFAGLAIGAFTLDGPIRRARSPRVAYAILEAVICAWGIVSVWLLPVAGRALPPLLGTEPGSVVLWIASFLFPILILLPATVAMGGTLIALECLIARASKDGHRGAGVYAANTAGAVAGTLVTAFVLFSALGMSGTLVALAVVNASCAVAILAWTPVSEAPPDSTFPISALPGRSEGRRLTATLLVTGLLGVAVEVVVVRLASQTLQNTLYSFAGLLSAYLLGTTLGSHLWQRWHRKTGTGRAEPLLASASLACVATAALAPYSRDIADRAAGFGVAGELGVALALFLLPSAAMGALFGHLLQRTRDGRGSIGWAIGINSVGAALAPLIATQVLIPAFGAWRALVVAAAGYVALLPMRRSSLPWCTLSALPLVALLALPAPSLIRVPPGGDLLAVREGPMATASAVTDDVGVRYLEVNGRFRMGGTSSMRSDYRQAILPLLLHRDPTTALFLGVGTGATLAGGSTLPGVSVRGVELLSEVVDLLPQFVASDERAPFPSVVVADARRYVAADSARYDVVVADLFHPALDGSGSLYTTEHFAAVKRRLAPNGLFCQWLPLYQLDATSLRAIVRSFLEIYPDASAWLNHYSVRTPMLALVGYADAGRVDGDALASRLARPDILERTRPLGIERTIDVFGQFMGGSGSLRRFAADAPLNTDDRPFVALDAGRNVRALKAPPATLLISLIHALKPDTGDLPGKADVPAARLTAYWRARDRFLEAGAALRGEPRGVALVEAASPGLLEAIRLSADFDPAYQPLLNMARSLMSSNREAAVGLLRAIDAAAPSRGEARDLLASQLAHGQGMN